MRNPDLQAHFEKMQKRDAQARENNLDSGLTCALENLSQFLGEEDTDAALTYLEDEVGIQALIAQKHTFPESLKPKAALLQNIYADLKNNSSDPLDLSETISNILANDKPCIYMAPAANDPY